MPRRLLSLRLENDVLYRDQEFKFDNGLYLILGANKDANPGATNAAGKSRFFGALPELIYDEPVTGKESRVKSKRDTRTTIEWEDLKGNTLKAIRHTGKHNRLELFRNGKPRKNERLDYSYARLQEDWGISEEEWYTLYFIDPKNRANDLIKGNTTKRQRYLIDLFRLTGEDQMKKLLLLDLHEATKAKAALEEVNTSYEDLRKRHSELKGEDVDLDELKVRRKKLTKRITEAQREQELWSFKTDNADLFKAFGTPEKLERLDDELEKIDAELLAIRKARKAIERYQVYRSKLKDYKATAAPIQAKLDELGLTEEQAEAGNDRYQEAKASLTQASNEGRDLVVVDKVELAPAPAYDVAQCTARIESIQVKLEEHKEFEGGKCPTCGQAVDQVDTAALEAKLSKWKTRRKEAQRYESQTEKARARTDYVARKKEIGARIAKAEEAIAANEHSSRAHRLYRELPSRPERVDKPEGESGSVVGDFEEISSLLNRKRDKVERALTLRDKMLEALPIEKPTASLTELNEKLERVTKKINNAEAKAIIRRELKEQGEDLARRGKLLKRQAQDVPVLKALVKAYSTKGLQKLKLQRYVQFLEKQVNKFRKLVFSEDISFEFIYGTQLQILAHRKYGKTIKSSDVRKLSGAETLMFTLLLLVANLSLIPASRRMQFVILDEPTAALGEEAIEAFARFLPVLLKVIPCVIIITPKSHERYEGAKVFTATKHKGQSKLIPMKGTTST